MPMGLDGIKVDTQRGDKREVTLTATEHDDHFLGDD